MDDALARMSNLMTKRFAASRRLQVRAEHLDEIVRVLNKPPSLYRNMCRSPRKLRGECAFVAQNSSRREGWKQSQTVAQIMIMDFTITPHRFHTITRPIAQITLHALARRFQRGFKIDDEAIRTDVFVPIHYVVGVLRRLQDRIKRGDTTLNDWQFAIRCEGGAWFGYVGTVRAAGEKETLVLSIRTYFSNDDLANQLAPAAEWLELES
jgi:hypothetical protein